MSFAYCEITFESNPKFLSPINDSPESFNKILLNLGNMIKVFVVLVKQDAKKNPVKPGF